MQRAPHRQSIRLLRRWSRLALNLPALPTSAGSEARATNGKTSNS